MAYRLCRILFATCIARPVALFFLGLNVRNRAKLKWHKPSIIVANHNSHLDTLVLLSMAPLNRVHLVNPAAAADYFLHNRFIAWLSRNWLGIVAVLRECNHRHPLAECQSALEKGHTLILFPEGSRGQPEKMQSIKSGIALLAKQFPHIPVLPIFMHGLGRSLPKGEWIPIPFFCDVFVGDQLYWSGDKKRFLNDIANQFEALRKQLPATWMRKPK